MSLSSVQKKNVLFALGWDSFGFLFLIIVQVLSSIIFVRMLGKQDYGTYVFILSLFTTIVTIGTMGVKTVILKFIPKFEAEKNASKLLLMFKKLINFRFLLYFLTSILIFFYSEKISLLLIGSTNLSLYFKIGFLVFFSLFFQDIFEGLLITKFRQRFLHVFKGLTSIFSLLLSIVLIKIGMKVFGILFSIAIGNILYLLGVLFVFNKYLMSYRYNNLNKSNWEFIYIYKYTLFIYIYFLFQYAFDKNVDIIFLGALLKDSIALTHFSLAYDFGASFIRIIILVFQGGIIISLISDLFYRKDYAALRNLYICMFDYIIIFSFPIATILALFSDSVFYVIFGLSFNLCSKYAIIFLFLFAVQNLGAITTNFLLATRGEKNILYIGVILATLKLILFYYLIPRYGVIAAIGVIVFINLNAVLWESVFLHKILRPRYPISCLLKVSFACFIIYAIMKYLRTFMSAFSVNRAMGILIPLAFLLYYLLIIFLKPLSTNSIELLKIIRLPRFLIKSLGKA